MGDLGIIIVNTELNDKNSCYQLIITITIFEKKIHLEQISPIETISQGKYFSILEIPQFFPRISTCCYLLLWSILWLVDLAGWTKYDWLFQLSDYRCPLTVKYPIKLSDYNSTKWLVKN